MSQKLPSLAELHQSPEEAFKNDQLKTLLNVPPHASWLKKNKYANNSEYLPIDKHEFLLDRIFQEWKIDVLETKAMFNAVQVTVRVNYKNPINGEWMHHDGVGASELQTVAASGCLKPDMSNIGKGAVEMAVPKAKTAAIKDATNHLGSLFGRDLNRKDTIAFVGAYSEQPKAPSALDNFKLHVENGITNPVPAQQPNPIPSLSNDFIL